MWDRTPRIRGRKLQQIRKRAFQKQPLCVPHLAKGEYVVATELDHIVPLFRGGTDTPDNRQPICFDCHQEKSKAERGQKLKPSQPLGLDW